MRIELMMATFGNWQSKWNGDVLLIELTKKPPVTLFSEKSTERDMASVLRSCHPRATWVLNHGKPYVSSESYCFHPLPSERSHFRHGLPQRSPHLSPAVPTSSAVTYLPIRVIAPASGPCQGHSPGICISAGCAQDKMPCSAAPGAPGHCGQNLKEGKKKQVLSK